MTRTKIKGGHSGRPYRTLLLKLLEDLHVLCLPAFGTFDDVELHRLAFLQAAETVRLNCGEMNENVFSILTGNKAVALRVIEPLNCSLFHCVTRIPYI